MKYGFKADNTICLTFNAEINAQKMSAIMVHLHVFVVVGLGEPSLINECFTLFILLLLFFSVSMNVICTIYYRVLQWTVLDVTLVFKSSITWCITIILYTINDIAY